MNVCQIADFADRWFLAAREPEGSQSSVKDSISQKIVDEENHEFLHGENSMGIVSKKVNGPMALGPIF